MGEIRGDGWLMDDLSLPLVVKNNNILGVLVLRSTDD